MCGMRSTRRAQKTRRKLFETRTIPATVHRTGGTSRSRQTCFEWAPFSRTLRFAFQVGASVGGGSFSRMRKHGHPSLDLCNLYKPAFSVERRGSNGRWYRSVLQPAAKAKERNSKSKVWGGDNRNSAALRSGAAGFGRHRLEPNSAVAAKQNTTWPRNYD